MFLPEPAWNSPGGKKARLCLPHPLPFLAVLLTACVHVDCRVKPGSLETFDVLGGVEGGAFGLKVAVALLPRFDQYGLDCETVEDFQPRQIDTTGSTTCVSLWS